MSSDKHCAIYYVPKGTKPRDMLRVLQDREVVLIEGDLVALEGPRYRNENLYIFNGKSLIELDDDIDEYGALPPRFHVFENGIPANYWSHDSKKGLEGISHNNIVWLNYDAVRDQCIANLVVYETDVDEVDEDEIGKSHTTFYLKDDPEPYYIYFRNHTKVQILEILDQECPIFDHFDEPRSVVVSMWKGPDTDEDNNLSNATLMVMFNQIMKHYKELPAWKDALKQVVFDVLRGDDELTFWREEVTYEQLMEETYLLDDLDNTSKKEKTSTKRSTSVPAEYYTAEAITWIGDHPPNGKRVLCYYEKYRREVGKGALREYAFNPLVSKHGKVSKGYMNDTDLTLTWTSS